jgi:hypothetical protein
MTIEIPGRGEREYLRAFGVVAVYVAAPPARSPCTIGATRNLGLSQKTIRRRWHWAVGITHAWWTAGLAQARSLNEVIAEGLPLDRRGRFDLDAETVADKIQESARRLGLSLTAHAETMKRAKEALARIDAVIAENNAAGELKWFNAAYREWRLSVPPENAMPYGSARSRLRVAVVRRIAAGVGGYHVGPDLLADVFPNNTFAARNGARRVMSHGLEWRKNRSRP